MKDLLLKRKGRVFLFGMACMLPILCYTATQYAIGLMFNSIDSEEIHKRYYFRYQEESFWKYFKKNI